MKKTLALITLAAIIFLSSCNDSPEQQALKVKYNLASVIVENGEVTVYKDGKAVLTAVYPELVTPVLAEVKK